jgi:hypothetical protein
MEKVNIEPLDRGGWECPKCGDWMELEDDPNYMATVTCEGCEREYEPIVAR